MYATHGQNGRRSQPATAHNGSPTIGSHDKQARRRSEPFEPAQRVRMRCAGILRHAFVDALGAVAHPPGERAAQRIPRGGHEYRRPEQVRVQLDETEDGRLRAHRQQRCRHERDHEHGAEPVLRQRQRGQKRRDPVVHARHVTNCAGRSGGTDQCAAGSAAGGRRRAPARPRRPQPAVIRRCELGVTRSGLT